MIRNNTVITDHQSVFHLPGGFGPPQRGTNVNRRDARVRLDDRGRAARSTPLHGLVLLGAQKGPGGQAWSTVDLPGLGRSVDQSGYPLLAGFDYLVLR